MTNTLYYGDNLEVLRQHIADASVDLVYLDPPFNSNTDEPGGRKFAVSLPELLAKARTEEDVKDAYIKALGLKSYFKGLVDIQTEEVWFEAKAVSTPPIVMFAQLFFYARYGFREFPSGTRTLMLMTETIAASL